MHTRLRLRRLSTLIVLTLSPFLLIASAQDDGDFAPADCPIPVEDNVECGYLSVPEDRTDPNSPDIALAVAIIRATGDALPDPIVFLEGGPGGSALTGIDAWYDTIYGENRDIILIDQRGTGYSEPILFCEEGTDAEAEAATACRNDLEAQGIDLAAYTSATNAADIEALRLALGYEQINLYSVSYGTRLAMTVMRDFPNGLRSVILDSPYPPAADAFNDDGSNFLYAVETLATDCAANGACNAAFPDLENFLYDLLERTSFEPVVVDGEEYFSGDIIEMLYGNFYDTTIIPFLPAIIYDIAEGRSDALVAYEMTLDIDMGDDDMDAGEGDFVDFDAMSDDEFDSFLMDALGYETIDDLYDYLDTLSDEEYNDLLDDLAMGAGDDTMTTTEDDEFVDFDAMSDDEFDSFLMDALDYDTVDDLYAYLDTLSDEEYNDLLNELGGFDDFMDEDAPMTEDDIDRSDAQGMFNSVTCAEEIPFSSLEQQATLLANAPTTIQDHFRGSFISSIEVCEAWGVPLSDAIEDEIVVSDIPTLILVGQYDVATPPVWADLAAEGLSNVTVLEFPGAGHAIIDATPCAREVGLAFFDDPTSDLTSTCVDQIGAPDFYVP